MKKLKLKEVGINIQLTDYELTIQNLHILMEHWKERKDEVNLHMLSYGGINYLPYNGEYSTPNVHPCGTSCCVLGLAPEVLDVYPSHFPNGFFSYGCFGKTHFPYLYNEGCIGTSVLWEYLFSSRWPNDIDHAIERMRRVVEGEVTSNISYVQYREELVESSLRYEEMNMVNIS